MSVAEPWNVELGQYGRLMNRLLRAWREELVALTPARLRRRLRPAVTAEVAADGGFVLSRRGLKVFAPSPAGGRIPVVLRVPADLALVCETVVPDARPPDIARMVALDLDRLTPFEADAVFFGIGLASEADALGRRRVLLAAAPRGPILALISEARAAGLEPRVVELAATPQGWPAVDLSESLAGRLAGARGATVGRLWLLVALLAAIDVAVAVQRDVSATNAVRAQAQALRPRILVDQRLRQRVLAEESRRAGILAARARGEPLRVLNVVTAALPDGAWAERLSWNGAQVRIFGYRRPGLDVTAALRASPSLIDVRNTAADIAGGSAAGMPFDVSARVRVAGRGP